MIENAVRRSKLQEIPIAAVVRDLSYTRAIRAELGAAIAKLECVDDATPQASSKGADVLIQRAIVTIELLLLKVADAHVLTLAKAFFGSDEEVTRWMQAPLIELDCARPVDLMQTSEGKRLVATYLIVRLDTRPST